MTRRDRLAEYRALRERIERVLDVLRAHTGEAATRERFALRQALAEIASAHTVAREREE